MVSVERRDGKGKGLQLCSSRSCLCCMWWYLNIELGTCCTRVIDGPLKLHWSRRCRSTVSSLAANYWIITKTSTSQWSAGPLSSYPVGQNTHLGRKVCFSSSFLGRFKQIQSSDNLYPCHLRLVFLREELHPVWLDQLHVTVLQAHVCTRYWDLNQPWTIWSTMQIKIK